MNTREIIDAIDRVSKSIEKDFHRGHVDKLMLPVDENGLFTDKAKRVIDYLRRNNK